MDVAHAGHTNKKNSISTVVNHSCIALEFDCICHEKKVLCCELVRGLSGFGGTTARLVSVEPVAEGR